MRYGKVMVVVVSVAVLAGCESLRFAPGETQKQNAYLHHRTVQAAANVAKQEESSAVLQELTGSAVRQSDSIVAYYGLPRELPAIDTVEEILSEGNSQLVRAARMEAVQRPDPWDVADHLLELGVALAGVVGGVYGTRALGLLRMARQKSTALREIVWGNELFRRQSPQANEAFKQAHGQQSGVTRSLVAEMKSTQA